MPPEDATDSQAGQRVNRVTYEPAERVEVLKAAYSVRCDRAHQAKDRAGTLAYSHAAVLLAIAGLVARANFVTTWERKALVACGLISLTGTVVALLRHYQQAYRFSTAQIVRLDKAFQFWTKGAFIPQESLYTFPEGWGGSKPREFGYFQTLMLYVGVVSVAALLFIVFE